MLWIKKKINVLSIYLIFYVSNNNKLVNTNVYSSGFSS